MRHGGILLLVVALSATVAFAEISDDKNMSPGPANLGALPDATGGPDDFGYIFADNAEAACATLFSYVDITGSGAPAGLTGVDDDYAGPFPIGFSFDFYGSTYTDFFVSSNGTLYFEDAYLGLSNACPLPAFQGYIPSDIFIAHYHDDLVVESDGDVFYETFANCPVGAGGQCTIVQYSQIRAYGSSEADMDWEIVLFEDGSIVFLYLQPSNDSASQNNGGSATVGIQGSPNASPVWAVEYSCNAASLSAGLAIAFAPPSAVTGGEPNVCGEQATPTPAGPQPVPTASNTGLIILIILVAAAALIFIGRRAI